MMRPRLVLAIAGALIGSASAYAHDLWLQPTGFWPAPDQPIALSILIGHGATRENWGIRSDRIILLRDVLPNGQLIDLLPLIRRGSNEPVIRLKLTQPGSHVLAMQSNDAQSVLPAARFNEFIAEEGMTPAIRHRAANRATDLPGREDYSRRAKAIVQVGAPDTRAIQVVSRRIGFDLEIVPERHPYLLAPGEKLPVRVYWQGQPLAGALVKLTNLDADEKPLSMLRTNAAGRAGFAVPRHGKYLLNTVWTTPVAGQASQFKTIFSSLTFGDRP